MGRTLTDEQKARRAVTRQNNKLKKEMPLFAQADALDLTTEREEVIRLKKKSAGRYQAIDVTSEAAEQLRIIEERWLARLAKKHVPADWFAVLETYCHETYPAVDYWLGFWRDVLTGTRHVLTWELRFDPARVNQSNSDGRYLVEDLVWPPEGWQSLCKPEEWEAVVGPAYITRLKSKPHQPEDDGLWAKVQAAIDRAAVQ